MKESSLPIVTVVPLVPLSSKAPPFFSYLPEPNNPAPVTGSIVSIPFGSRIVLGITWDLSQQGAHVHVPQKFFRYKALLKTLVPRFLGAASMRFTQELSRQTGIPLGSVLEHALSGKFPTISAKRQLASSLASSDDLDRRHRIRITAKEQGAVHLLLDSASRRDFPVLFLCPPGSSKVRILSKAIERISKNKGQALLIVPDHGILECIREFLSQVFLPRKTFVFHQYLSNSKKRSVAEIVRTNTPCIILGTPHALFLPFNELQVIVQDDADAPLYSTARSLLGTSVHHATSILAESHGATFIRASSAPSFVSFSRAQETHSLVEFACQRANLSLSVINLRIERWKKKLAPISETVMHAIAAALSQKQQIILLVCRSGMSALSICSHCKNILRCEICKRPLDYRRDGDYLCRNCRKSSGTTPKCTVCGSLVFKHIGFGSERIERDIRRRFPYARCVRYDEASSPKKSTLRELEEFSLGERDILISTQKGIYGWDLPRLALIAIMDADTLFNIPGWDSDERTFRLLLAAAEQVRVSKNQDATLFVQTFHPENPLFEQLKSGDISSFFSSLETDRRSLLFPPFAKNTRWVISGMSEKRMSLLADEVRRHIDSKLAGSTRNFRFSGRVCAQKDFRGKTKTQEMLFRYVPNAKNDRVMQDILALVRKVSPHVFIEESDSSE